eukprot:9214325-Alexandrium_andersonii.AAC.1
MAEHTPIPMSPVTMGRTARPGSGRPPSRCSRSPRSWHSARSPSQTSESAFSIGSEGWRAFDELSSRAASRGPVANLQLPPGSVERRVRLTGKQPRS